jgi:opine dehydrogenase
MGRAFVIIGAGNGGQSLAGDMIIRGVKVAAICDNNPAAIASIEQKGGITMSGPVVEGFAPVKCATTDLKEAVQAGDVILVTITANFHKDLASSIAPYISASQAVIIIPGYVGSSMLFAKTLIRAGIKQLPLIGETISLPYATRLIEPAHAGIKARKAALPVAALPATNNETLLAIFKEAIPEAILFKDTLSVGFNNPNPISHVPIYLFNLGRVESKDVIDGDFHSWGTPTINRIKDQLDNERLAVMKAMGLQTLSYADSRQLLYKGKPYKPLPQTGRIPSNASQAPDRFIDEDVPMGLVPMAIFGDMVGTDTPTIDILIRIANLIRRKNFESTGRTLDYMGVADMALKDILSFTREAKF